MISYIIILTFVLICKVEGWSDVLVSTDTHTGFVNVNGDPQDYAEKDVQSPNSGASELCSQCPRLGHILDMTTFGELIL